MILWQDLSVSYGPTRVLGPLTLEVGDGELGHVITSVAR